MLKAKCNALRKLAALGPGRTNENSPAFSRLGIDADRPKSRRDGRSEGRKQKEERRISAVPSGLTAL
jgi:hypothetical protein